MVKLNLGCGGQVLDGWINVDYALGARLMKVPFFRAINQRLRLFDLDWNDKIFLHNLTKPFPWQSGSVDVTYSSHTLEHMSREEGRQFLSECFRVLRPGGVIRIIVPDLRWYVDDYINGKIKAEDFLEKLDVLYLSSPNALKSKMAPFIQFPHKCMYDNERLVAVLKDIGFDASVRAPFDSEIDDIRQIEIGGRTDNAVVVEGRKRA